MSAYDVLLPRSVTRLCHFTKLQSFTHIITSEEGVLASKSIRQDTKNVIDKARYDGELDHVCTTVEYPNSWFLNRAIELNQDSIFNDWVVLYIDLSILNDRSIKFCACNASRANGAYINQDPNKIESIFSHSVPTFRYPRTPQMLPACPTDGQAEILIADNIPRRFIQGIALGNEDVAKRVYAILKMCDMAHIPLYIAPDVLTPKWSSLIKSGRRPEEIPCAWPEEGLLCRYQAE